MKYLITTSALFQIFLFGTLTINAQELRVNTSYSRLDGGVLILKSLNFILLVVGG